MSRKVKNIFVASIVGAFAVLISASSTARSQDRNLPEIQRYTLTMPNVTRFWETLGSLAKVAKDHPELKDAFETDADKHEDFAAVEKRTASIPLLKSSIIDHGLTVHEFVLIEVTLFQSALASALSPPGPDRAKRALEAGVNPANLDFIDTHKAELEELQAKNMPKDGGGI